MEAISAVSSPQTKAPAPSLILMLKIKSLTENIFSQETFVPAPVQWRLSDVHRQGIFRADIDIAFIGADGIGGNHHAFQDRMGIAFQDAAVHKRAGVAFIGIADNIFFIAFGLAGEFHLSPVGKPPPPRPRNPDFMMISITWFGVYSCKAFLDGLIPAMGNVIINGTGIDDAAISQNDLFLFLEKSSFFIDVFIAE